MRKLLLPILASGLLAACAATPFSEVSPALRSEFAPSGTLIAGINFGNAVIVQRPKPGEHPLGVGPDVARELARRLAVPIRYVTFESAREAADAVTKGEVDIAFVAVDPARAQGIAFSAPYVQIDGTYLVPKSSPLRHVDEFDRKGLRIAVGEKSAYDLYLTRVLKQASLVRVPTSGGAAEEVMARRTDATAGVRQALEAAAKRDPSLRVIESSFMSIGQASGVPRARTAAAKYLHEFIEEMKASGFVARALARSGVEASVAPAAGKP